MSWAFVLLFVASCALVAYATSALCGIGLLLSRTVSVRIDAAGRARSWLVVATLPVVASVVVFVGAFGPYVGLAPDHCASHLVQHVHLCFAHPAQSTSLLLILPASLLSARLLTRTARAATAVRHARALQRSLMAARIDRIGDAMVLSTRQPVAFVIGWLSPTLFVSTGLLARPAAEVSAVLAHERAHAARRDPLRRLAATVLLAFHLPGIAELLERRLGIIQEMAADADAALALGDRLSIAEALVRVAREREHGDSSCEVQTGVVSARVLELLSDPPRTSGPPISAIAGAFAAFVAAIAASAGAVHHLLEHALHFLGA